MWDLLLDDDYMHNLNRYHLLGNHFDSIAIACNCNTVYGEICIVELGKNVEEIFPVEYNNFYLRPKDSVFRDITDPDQFHPWNCYPDMPDYYFCVWLWGDFSYEQGFGRRLQANQFPVFKLAFDPTCAHGRREGYCGEIDYEAS